MSNMDAARRAENECSAEIKVIKKTSKEYGMGKDLPPCPSVKVNNRFIAKNGTITYEALRTAIISDCEVKETA